MAAPADPRISSVDPDLCRAALQAIAAMARNSKRHQAELGIALDRAGLTLSASAQVEVLKQLAAAGSVEQIIPLEDGAVLLSVTPAGMQRAGR